MYHVLEKMGGSLIVKLKFTIKDPPPTKKQYILRIGKNGRSLIIHITYCNSVILLDNKHIRKYIVDTSLEFKYSLANNDKFILSMAQN